MEEIRNRLLVVETAINHIDRSIAVQERINLEMKERQESMDSKVTEIHNAFVAAKGVKWIFYSLILPMLAFIGAKITGLFDIVVRNIN